MPYITQWTDFVAKATQLYCDQPTRVRQHRQRISSRCIPSAGRSLLTRLCATVSRLAMCGSIALPITRSC
jgi:hypothetical protein